MTINQLMHCAHSLSRLVQVLNLLHFWGKLRSERERCVRMNNDYDKVLFGCFIIAVIILLIGSCCTSPTVLVLPPETIQQTPQPQQDIETGHMQVLMFKDLNEEEVEEGDGKSSCPICLEEYENDHEIRRLKKCRHVFHRFCIDSWLTHAPSCPSCRRSVDLMSLGL